jgi:hypothetical protein
MVLVITWRAPCVWEREQLKTSLQPFCEFANLLRHRYIIIAMAFYVYPDDAGDIGQHLHKLF